MDNLSKALEPEKKEAEFKSYYSIPNYAEQKVLEKLVKEYNTKYYNVPAEDLRFASEVK